MKIIPSPITGFLTTFDFNLVQGDRKTALAAPYSVIVTEETAEKLFNTTDVLGKIIKADGIVYHLK